MDKKKRSQTTEGIHENFYKETIKSILLHNLKILSYFSSQHVGGSQSFVSFW